MLDDYCFVVDDAIDMRTCVRVVRTAEERGVHDDDDDAAGGSCFDPHSSTTYIQYSHHDHYTIHSLLQ